ncbi:PREDICTED: ATPase family AAA domain-containing protein 3-B-like [Amphimedon queenslandica]|uniref:ATPase AAA-type core domain-containing protein n=1 Tax=Amphimedon queenslandica TaxID=400682 RepID=A0A1X7TX86_AMPQE|nr:PREDICTED: ATPase family AAA domain-containing protein 3-B-like [Amphimedon queenslandica]|eukprot:XP_003389596.1 PREDICTED: ATPase family AAA domain-containing protein 3-B-like [Amphimedon queenslandica]
MGQIDSNFKQPQGCDSKNTTLNLEMILTKSRIIKSIHLFHSVVLFVDEADAFLRKRSKVSISENLRSTLNAFLYRTGEASSKFMLVLASNQPDQFDWAINDRLDDLVHFDLPGEEERYRLLKQYFTQYVLSPPRTSWWRRQKMIPTPPDINWEECFKKMSTDVAGFSGREIAKLAVAWQAAAYGSPGGELTVKMINDCVNEMISQHKQKRVWQDDEVINE